MRRARLATGVAIAALYVVVAQLSFHEGLLPVRPLYDGTTPPPAYRWVNPPLELAAGNELPSEGKHTVTFGKEGAEAASVNTDDAQASVIIAPQGLVAAPGETKVNVRIEPLDPATLGEPPAGFDYDGNGYRFTATYAKSGKPAPIPSGQTCSLTEPNLCATIVLRYAFTASALFRLDGATWVKLPTQSAGAALQIYGATDKLGVFVAADTHVAGGPKKKSQTGNVIAFVLGFIAILAGTFFARVRAVRRRKRARPQRKKSVKRRQ